MNIYIESRKTGTSISLSDGVKSDAIHEFVVIEDAQLIFDHEYPYLKLLDNQLNRVEIKHTRENSKALDFCVHFKNVRFEGFSFANLDFKMCVFENCTFENDFKRMDFKWCRFENCEGSNGGDLKFEMCNIESILLCENSCARFTLCDVTGVRLFDECSVIYHSCIVDEKAVMDYHVKNQN